MEREAYSGRGGGGVRGKSGAGEAGAGVLRVEKENRAKEGEADAFFAGM